MADNASIIIARLRARAERLKPESPEMQAAFHKIGMTIQARARMNITRLGMVDRGSLRESIQYKLTDDGLSVGSFGVRYAAIHEFGGPFTARMRRAMFATMRRRGGPERPSKGVIQGGRFRARPYLRPAVNESRDFIISTLRELFK